MISVIFPTRNRGELLSDALASLEQQTLSRDLFEVLVIDNGSTDNTRAVADHWSQALPRLRYVMEETPGLHRGRHRGMNEACFDILTFADDDIIADPSWLSAIAEGFTDPSVGIVGGNNRPLFEADPPDWLLKLWNEPRAIGGKALPYLSILELEGGVRSIEPSYIWGCNFSIRRPLLKAVGGFHPDGLPRELMQFRGDGESHVARHAAELGAICLFHPRASVMHRVSADRMTPAYFRSRGFAQGVSDSYAELRADGGGSLRALLYGILRNAYQTARRQIVRNPDLRMVLAETAKGYSEGRAFHQNAYRRDPRVREWVKREDYYD